MGKTLWRLIKWVVMMLILAVVGTVLGWVLVVIFTEVPTWILIVVVMVMEITLFKFAVWTIEQQD